MLCLKAIDEGGSLNEEENHTAIFSYLYSGPAPFSLCIQGSAPEKKQEADNSKQESSQLVSGEDDELDYPKRAIEMIVPFGAGALLI